jgi:hypothetical protein
MTVIAWHGATKTLAADRMASNGNTAFATRKVFESNGYLIGLAGDGPGIGAFVAWFAQGADPEEFPPMLSGGESEACLVVSALVIDPDGGVLLYESSPFPMEVREECFAIGSGAEFAMAAMAMGKDAVESVRLASEMTVTCGKGFDFLVLGAKP